MVHDICYGCWTIDPRLFIELTPEQSIQYDIYNKVYNKYANQQYKEIDENSNINYYFPDENELKQFKKHAECSRYQMCSNCFLEFTNDTVQKHYNVKPGCIIRDSECLYIRLSGYDRPPELIDTDTIKYIFDDIRIKQQIEYYENYKKNKQEKKE